MIPRIRPCVLLIALIAAIAPLPAQTSAASVLVGKARALEGRGRPDLAAQTWKQVLLADPNDQEALAALARFAKQGGRVQESQTYLDRLAKINPNHPALKQVPGMAVLVQQQARLKEAERLAANQQFDQAMQIYRQIFGDDPPPGALAIAYYETQAAVPGGWESATAGLRKLTETYPESEGYRLALGRLWTYRPSTRMAGMKLLESVNGASDAVNKARQAWRQALVWEGSNPQVAPSLRAYLAKYPDPELQKMLESAAAAPSQASRPTGLARTPTENLGYAALKANTIKEAEKHFQKALEENPKSAGALAGMGFVRMKQENFAGAVTFFESAKEESPKDKAIMDALETAQFWKTMKDATDAFQSSRFSEAVDAYRQALVARPNNAEALQGLGGTLIKMGDAAAAWPIFEKLTQEQPQNDDAWYQLINARYRASGADSALALTRQIPESVRIALARNVNYLALLAVANADAGHQADSKRYLQEGVELANTKGLDLPASLQMQFAGLYLRDGYPNQAASVFQRVVDTEPENLDAWEGLLAALVQLHQEGRAARLIDRMPASVNEAAQMRPALLRSLAAISTSLGQLKSAEKLLQRSVELEPAADDPANLAAKLQLAHIWLAQGRPQQAESLLRDLMSSHPDSPDVWKALLAALHQEKKDDAVLAEDTRVPPFVHNTLMDDPDYVALLGASENEVVRYPAALRLIRRAVALLKQQNRPIPADTELQLAWLILNTQGDEHELYTLLTGMGKRTDLSDKQQSSVLELWSTWSSRRATEAIAGGDPARAVAILDNASRLLPNDTKIRASLAGALLQANEFKRALAVYQAWGMKDATAADYAGAIGAAMSAGDTGSAKVWVDTALRRWPNQAQLLVLAGNLAVTSGDYKHAQRYFRSALAAVPTDVEVSQSQRIPPPPSAAQDPKQALGELLVGASSAPHSEDASPAPAAPLPTVRPAVPPASKPATTKAAPPAGLSPMVAVPVKPAPSRNSQSNQLVLVAQHGGQVLPRLGTVPPDPAAALDPGPAATAPAEDSPAPSAGAVLPNLTGTAVTPDPAVPVKQNDTTLRSDIQQRLDAIDARDTPFFGTGASMRARSGESGYEHLVIEEADLEASAVIHDKIRVSIIGHPMYLDAGKPDGLSDKRFGLLPKGATFDQQSAGGVGGEVQLSTQTFGLRAGVTPTDFLVNNVVGGLRFRPGNGPVTILLERDNIRDSMLSFAGARDPVTNRVWGGVMANSVSLLGNWGGAKSGFYAGGGYQNITGQNVETNQRIDGDLGVYWRVMEVKGGAITAGFNVSGMHYDKNLRYFTLGQGGYFSPQQYFLANVPIQWSGVYNRRVQYSVKASFGAQHFQEDSSPYYPTLPSIQGRNGPYYPSLASTGANYSVDVNTAVQLTPMWYIGLYLNANNTYNYNAANAGVFLRYTLGPRPMDQSSDIGTIPDWKGVDLFRLR
ncbi:MAG: BCSC C-terminal domain-containing protein [Acidobacteriia bacterium]|nr:BCSC C-terminal domain-containing protein [Terriglobia bacterium]